MDSMSIAKLIGTGCLLAAPGFMCLPPHCAAQTTSTQRRQAPARGAEKERLLAAGAAALESGDIDAAKKTFEQVLRADASDVTAHTYLGVIADGANDVAEAEKHFAMAARLAPASASAHNNYGAVLLKLKHPKEAAVEFTAALKLDAQQPDALVNLAQIHFANGTPADLRTAADLFARALAIKPDASLARALTVVALRLNNAAAAQNYYREYTTRLAGSPAQNGATDNAAARAELGGALYEAGLLPEAEAELTAALALDPAQTDAVVRLAQVYLARKDIPAAGRMLEAALARGLDAAPVYALLAEVYEQSGHYENAIPAMRLAIQRDPQSEHYRFRYGMLLTSALAPAAAEIRLKEALQAFPTSSKLWFALGLAYFKSSKNDDARQAFARAIELDPKYAPAYAYLGMTHVELGQYAEAIKLYEQSLQANGKLAVVHYLIANTLLNEQNADAARIEAELKQAVALDPTFAPSHLTLGKLYNRMERWAEAVAQLQQAVALDADLAEAYYQLGRAYGRLKRTAEAQAVLAKFKTLSEAQKEKRQNEQREIARRLADVRF
jgi:tetratricopeptide (TPR) repeat protein